MKALIIDRDQASNGLIKSRVEALGHRVQLEESKNSALEKMGQEHFDLVFLDPSPLANARPVVLNIRRIVKAYPYTVLLSADAPQSDAIAAGANDVLHKPADPAKLEACILNAQRLTDLVRRIGDDKEDFPSAGGVIAKSAFNQLFLSAIDRADRYGERSFVVFIALRNYAEIRDREGPYAADFAAAKMAQHLVRLRRQSDIIAQTGKHEYALLLQRPIYETEPMEAANRFAENLAQLEDIASSPTSDVQLSVSLIDLPVGQLLIEHVFAARKRVL